MAIKTQMIDFPSNGQTTPGYLAQPDDANQHPAIVVIQEYWGLVPHIKDVAERFAREGFIALAPDLYHGQVAEEPDEARKMAMALDRNRAVMEINSAAKYLRSLAAAPKKIGVVGWCMGGALALSTGASSTDLGAIVAFYGRPLSVADTAKVRAPVLGLYAEKDHGIPPEAVKAFDEELSDVGVVHEIQIYPNVQHAFFNDTRPGIYDSAAAQDAWRRTLDWFRKYLVS